ncbi:hypothetical protein GCM10027185_11010 [Spirosoma pulveris]
MGNRSNTWSGTSGTKYIVEFGNGLRGCEYNTYRNWLPNGRGYSMVNYRGGK